jgi:prevent-host-death family protein
MPRKPSGVAEAQASWKLQDAKARFSEVVRLAAESGPQYVTVNGAEKAVILSTEDYRRLRGEPMGDVLVQLFAESDLADLKLEHPQLRGPVRDVKL